MAHREDSGAKDETPEMEARAHSGKFLEEAARLKGKKHHRHGGKQKGGRNEEDEHTSGQKKHGRHHGKRGQHGGREN